MGQRELQSLHAQMDGILKEVGYAQGTVGARMKALAKDPRPVLDQPQNHGPPQQVQPGRPDLS
jgi:hypothetical protein